MDDTPSRSPEQVPEPDPADPQRILDSPGPQDAAPPLTSLIPVPLVSPGVDPRERIPGPHGGWIGRGGKPGNRGGRGRPHQRIIVRAGQNLERELARLERMAKDARQVTCPVCSNVFTPPVTGRMDTRDRIAYARLCADVKASGKGDDEPPLQIHVTTGPVDPQPRDADPAMRDPAMGPPGFLNSGFAGE